MNRGLGGPFPGTPRGFGHLLGEGRKKNRLGHAEADRKRSSGSPEDALSQKLACLSRGAVQHGHRNSRPCWQQAILNLPTTKIVLFVKSQLWCARYTPWVVVIPAGLDCSFYSLVSEFQTSHRLAERSWNCIRHCTWVSA